MNEIYSKLNELFPRNANSATGTPQPSPQGLQGNGKPSPSPGAESAVWVKIKGKVWKIIDFPDCWREIRNYTPATSSSETVRLSPWTLGWNQGFQEKTEAISKSAGNAVLVRTIVTLTVIRHRLVDQIYTTRQQNKPIAYALVGTGFWNPWTSGLGVLVCK